MTMKGRRVAATALLAAWAGGSPAAAAQRETQMNDRTSLATLLDPVQPEAARIVRDERTTIRRVPAPFLRQGLIFRADHELPQRPITFTVGYARPSNFIVLLADNQEGFQSLVAQAGAAIETHEQRLAYAITWLETTRRFDQIFVVLKSFADLRPMADPNAGQRQSLQALRGKYENLIGLPVPGGSPPWTLPIYALQRNDLALFTVTIRGDGTGSVTRAVLEANTPLLPAIR